MSALYIYLICYSKNGVNNLQTRIFARSIDEASCYFRMKEGNAAFISKIEKRMSKVYQGASVSDSAS